MNYDSFSPSPRKYASFKCVMMLLFFCVVSDAFVLPSVVHTSTLSTAAAAAASLYAKNTNKDKKRVGGPRGAGRRGKPKKDGIIGDEEIKVEKRVRVPEPSKVRKRRHFFERAEVDTPLCVCTVEVDDADWWENPENENPYGGKLWPSSLAISELLVSLGDLKGYDLLELGCGLGLVSIVAGQGGARVVASDISPTVIKLCKIGWLETQKLRQEQATREENDVDSGIDETHIMQPGSLNTFVLDLFSTRPLPMSTSSSNKKIVIATAMMYDKDLAAILARRAFEACTRGAWVIIGDDDTGERDGGRIFFLSEMGKLESQKGVQFRRSWTSSVVKSKALQWSEKQVKILHLNMPQDMVLDNIPKYDKD